MPAFLKIHLCSCVTRMYCKKGVFNAWTYSFASDPQWTAMDPATLVIVGGVGIATAMDNLVMYFHDSKKHTFKGYNGEEHLEWDYEKFHESKKNCYKDSTWYLKQQLFHYVKAKNGESKFRLI